MEPKPLTEKAVTVTNGEIKEIVWAFVDTASAESASIDKETGVVTGIKAGTVKVKATVKATGEYKQTKTVVVEGSVTVIKLEDKVVALLKQTWQEMGQRKAQIPMMLQVLRPQCQANGAAAESHFG